MPPLSLQPSDPLEAVIGQQIAAHRRRAKISQTQLGEAIGVTFQQIQKYERGTNRVSAARLFRIAEFFDADLEVFFEVVEGGVE